MWLAGLADIWAVGHLRHLEVLTDLPGPFEFRLLLHKLNRLTQNQLGLHHPAQPPSHVHVPTAASAAELSVYAFGAASGDDDCEDKDKNQNHGDDRHKHRGRDDNHGLSRRTDKDEND